MTKSTPEAFNTFIQWMTPTAAERSATAGHRQSIYSKLNDSYSIYRMFESGSFAHGTGVRGHSDVDYFVSLKSDRPMLSSSILESVRSTLQTRFTSTYIHVSRPAVVLEFGSGYERVEVIPAYADKSVNDSDMRFQIPGVTNEWMYSTPEAHLHYVNAINTRAGTYHGAKELARMIKAWKYKRDVPISSFYLEMRAAAYMDSQTSISWPFDIKMFFDRIAGLPSMIDPTGATGYIEACSSTAKKTEALSKLATASTRATKALEYHQAGNISAAFGQWDLLWNGSFPAYY